MGDFDVVIVGGGMVGLSAACALSKTPMNIAVIDPKTELFKHLDDNEVMIRASAINLSSKRFLQEIDVWDDLINTKRTLAFDAIDVFEKQGIAKLDSVNFNNQFADLGYIIENQNIQNCLLKKAQSKKNITFIHESVDAIFNTEDRSFLTLSNNKQVATKLIIGADGAHSKVRALLDLKVIKKPYLHNALMATVKTELPHNACARQVFYADGIIAFLPLWKKNLSCLVWSVKPEEAKLLHNEDNSLVNQTLTKMMECMLGKCEIISEKWAFPLMARFCISPVQNRAILIGDAAHTIHPLAGQGVNLGFKDAKYLVNEIKQNLKNNNDIGLKKHYKKYQLLRQKDSLAMLSAMQIIHDTFNGDSSVKALARGIGMNVINSVPFLKKKIMKFGLGI